MKKRSQRHGYTTVQDKNQQERQKQHSIPDDLALPGGLAVQIRMT
jgi:hypothetical protein